MKRGELLNVDQTVKKMTEAAKVDIIAYDQSAAAGYYIGKRVFLRNLHPSKLNRSLPVVGTGDFSRDNGSIVMIPKNNQELLDLIINAYKVSEDRKVLLPAIVIEPENMKEEVLVPTKESIDKFLSHPKPKLEKKIYGLPSDIEKPMQEAKKLLEKAAERWRQKFHRSVHPVEADADGAEIVFVAYGRNAVTVSKVVKDLKEQGEKAGIVTVRVFRPWFGERIAQALEGKKVIIVDSLVSPGKSGILHSELSCGRGIVSKRISEQAVRDIFKQMKGAG